MSLNKPQERHPIALLCTVMLTTLVTSIDSTIANVALPHMQGSLAATQDQIAWVLTSYIVAIAIFIPPTAFFAARLGRRRMLLLCVSGFMLSSMLCGTATSLTQMVIFRLLQGAFAASMMPLGQAIVMDNFPQAKRGMVLSVIGAGVQFGPIVGPTLGGFLTEAFNWRWIFYINTPICLLALMGILRFIPDTTPRPDEPFDVFGFSVLTLGIAAFQLMLDRGQSLNWFASTEIRIEAVVACLGVYLFIVHVLTAEKPFIEPRIFKDRNLVVGLIMGVLISMVLMGQMALLPNYLQQLMHIPVDTTGNLMMSRGITSLICMLVMGRFIGRVNPRVFMIGGSLLMASATFELSRINLFVDQATIVRIGFQQGMGISMLMAQLSTSIFLTLAPDLRTEAASMYALGRNIGGSVGISLLFTHIAQLTQINHSQLTENITAFAGNYELPPAWQWSNPGGAMTLDAEIVRQATSVAYLNSYLLMTVCVVIVMPMCLLFRQK